MTAGISRGRKAHGSERRRAAIKAAIKARSAAVVR
jgi:hypothetical protein